MGFPSEFNMSNGKRDIFYFYAYIYKNKYLVSTNAQ